MLPSKVDLAIGLARWRAAILAWVGGLLVLAQMLAFAHVAWVEHRTCALHGEVVHTGHAAVTRVEPTAVTVIETADDASGDDHDHCVCMAPGRERFVLSSSVGDGSCASRLEGAHDIQLTVEPTRSIALLAFAPKHSPPA